MKNTQQQNATDTKARAAEGTASSQEFQIIIGEQPDRPAITIQPSLDFAAYEAERQTTDIGTTVGRLGNLLQATPSLLIASEARGRQLMEVVINGKLVRAADGNGFRAFAAGSKGINEHARLFEPKRLQNVINASAVWQIASVVVAQKHLADISRKLDVISEGVAHLSRFLNDQRRAQVEGAYRYLEQARTALMAGEISASVRTEIERCERDLLTLQIHLFKEASEAITELVPHSDTVGTDELAKGIAGKIRKQEALFQDLALCIRTRTCAWHVFSLFPGEPMLKESRRGQIQEAINEFGALAAAFNKALERDIRTMHSSFNRKSTLDRRRQTLTEQAARIARKNQGTQSSIDQALQDATGLLLRHDTPMRVLLQYQDGILEGVSQQGV